MPEKSPILQATDLLRVAFESLTLDEITAFVKDLIDAIHALVQLSSMPGFISSTARISAKHLEDKLRTRLGDAVMQRENLQIVQFIDEESAEDEAAKLIITRSKFR